MIFFKKKQSAVQYDTFSTDKGKGCKDLKSLIEGKCPSLLLNCITKLTEIYPCRRRVMKLLDNKLLKN